MSVGKIVRTWMLLLIVTAATSVPAFAQTELSGTWAAISHEDGLERGGGPYAVDYTGLPLNDEGRARALSYSASQFGVIEHQCGFWPPHYLVMGPFGMKIWNQTDPVTGKTIAWTIGSWEDRGLTTIWMDGRPHPSRSSLASAGRIHHRRMGRQYAGCLHHAHQGRSDTAQWCAEQRRRDDDHALPPARRPDDRAGDD